VYGHVPHAFDGDATGVILDHIERFARGFRDRILGTHVMRPGDVERYNANCVGGDIIGGVCDWRQMFTRPVARWDPYSTPAPELFLCSASTPPGAGVHGMCGYWAARSAMRRVFGIRG
jgi:phytoene dehydrogenase-like protein